MAEVRLDRGAFIGSIAKVTVESESSTVELALNFVTNTYDGSLFLTPGTHSLVGRAFDNDRLIGLSVPVAVDIQPGMVTRVELRIADLTGTDPGVYGPIIDALTYPTTAEAAQSATFAIAAVSPSGDPLSYAWSSSCSDATFSTPAAATTTWTKPTPGSCLISVVTTANVVSELRNFTIVVFPEGTGNGAATVNGTFVFAPALESAFDALGCFSSTGERGESCANPIASPAVTPYSVAVVNWGNSTPGTLELSDDCGGSFGVERRLPDSVSGVWLPPATGGVCFLTVRATNGDGSTAQHREAVLVRPGTAATAPPPEVIARITGFLDLCGLDSSSPPGTCSLFRGSLETTLVDVVLGGGHPGRLTITDDCRAPIAVESYFTSAIPWKVPNTPGAICSIRVKATTVEGSSTEVGVQYQVQ